MTWFPPEDEVTFTEQSCEFVLGSAVNDVASQGDTVEMLIRGRPGPENDIRARERHPGRRTRICVVDHLEPLLAPDHLGASAIATANRLTRELAGVVDDCGEGQGPTEGHRSMPREGLTPYARVGRAHAWVAAQVWFGARRGGS